MKSNMRIGECEYVIDLSHPIDISIPMHFNGPQPNAYGVERATSEPVHAGDLVGDTRQGGSVNFERYTFIPHCNGTHTECVGHITNERISILECLKDVLIPSILVSVTPETVNGDVVITRSALGSITIPPTYAGGSDKALIVRTLPNDDTKLTREYGQQAVPPYFSLDAIEYMIEIGVKHLLVDVPSIDRIFDDGKLLNHRLFWNVEPAGLEVTGKTRRNNTITEMICVPNEVEDGEYLLNLQIAPFASDCAPSRPILFLTESPV